MSLVYIFMVIGSAGMFIEELLNLLGVNKNDGNKDISEVLSNDPYYIFYKIKSMINIAELQFQVSSEEDKKNPGKYIINLSYPSE